MQFYVFHQFPGLNIPCFSVIFMDEKLLEKFDIQ